MQQPTKKVPFFNYKFFYDTYRQDILAITDDILKRGAFIMQQDVRDLEQRLASYLGAKHVLGMANCTDGLEIALQIADIGPGDEVIFSSHTFVATASAIHTCGAKPIPAECRKDHLIDPKSVEAVITDKTVAIMPTQLNGRTCDMDALQALADKHGLIIIEDAAQGLGSSFKGKKAGTFGMAAAVSFYPAKILGCLGDGGIFITNNDEVAERAYQIRDHGRLRNGKIGGWGRNSRLDNLQAAILNRVFDDYEQIIARRRSVAALYNERLSIIDDLILPPPPTTDSIHFDIFQNYEIESSHRDLLEQHLSDNGIGTLKQWGGEAVHQISGLGFSNKLPFTEKMTSRALLLPLNLSVTDEDINYVCDTIIHFYENFAQINTKNKMESIAS